MIRITELSQPEEEVMLKVEGWIEGEDVDVLAAEGDRYLQEGKRLVLDLRGVQLLDIRGLALVQRWWGERLVVQDASPVVQALLEVHGLRVEKVDPLEG